MSITLIPTSLLTPVLITSVILFALLLFVTVWFPKPAQRNKAMKALPPKEREVLTLRLFDEYSFEEISRKLAIPLNTVKSDFRRGIRNLRELLIEQKVTNDSVEF